MATFKKTENQLRQKFPEDERTDKNEKRKRAVESDDDEDNDEDDDDDDEEKPINKFANDGSFLEMFKKMQQQKEQSLPIISSASTSSTDVNSNEDDNIKSGTIEKTKRKPKILKVGIIEKTKKSTTKTGRRHDDDSGEHEDSAWSRYMNEVRAYKEKYGDDEDKNRPLVK